MNSFSMQLFVFLVLLLVCWIDGSSAQETGEESAEVPSVSVSKQDYCEGCKETVALYSRVSFDMLEDMKKKGVKPKSTLDAEVVVNKMCDHDSIKQYKDSIKYSCIKMMDEQEARIKFLEYFEGITSAPGMVGKAEIYRRKKDVRFHLATPTYIPFLSCTG